MIKRCEDPHNRRRHHNDQRHPSPPAKTRPAGQAAGPLPDREENAAEPPGPISAAVLRAARLSASADHVTLAGMLGTTESSLRDWEQGVKPLASVPFPLLDKLQTTLTDLGAQPLLVADIQVASRYSSPTSK